MVTSQHVPHRVHIAIDSTLSFSFNILSFFLLCQHGRFGCERVWKANLNPLKLLCDRSFWLPDLMNRCFYRLRTTTRFIKFVNFNPNKVQRSCWVDEISDGGIRYSIWLLSIDWECNRLTGRISSLASVIISSGLVLPRY